MEIDNLKSLNELREKGVLSEVEFVIEKKKILDSNNHSLKEIDAIHSKLKLVGRNLMNVFNSIIFLILFSIVAVVVIFIDSSLYENVFLVSLLVQLFVFIVILSNVYKAGKQLLSSNENNSGESMALGKSLLMLIIILLVIVIMAGFPFILAYFSS